MSKHVAVLMGGWSAERAVSLDSGRACVAALEERGYQVTPIDVQRDITRVLQAVRPDVAFNALHGRYGEDGTIQGLLELLEIPYTHSGILASALAMHKQRAKAVMKAAGVPVPEGIVVSRRDAASRHVLPPPYVIKPVNEGSSVGVAIVTADGNYGSPIGRDVEGPWQEFAELLAEPFIKGRELTVAVLNNEALAVTELKPKAGFYDYDAKYTDGLTVHVCPAEIPDDIARSMMDMAAAAHRLLGCKGASRSDFRWDDEQGEAGIYLLETNTQPGMTPLSLVPEQANYRGISYGELVERLIEEALADGGSS